MPFSEKEKTILIEAKLPTDTITALEAQDYDTLRSLRGKDMAWWKTKFPDLTEGRIDNVIAAVQDGLAAAAAIAVVPVAPVPALTGSGNSGLADLAAVLISIESQDLTTVLPGLMANPNDPRYRDRARDLLSDRDGNALQTLVVRDGQLTLSGVIVDESIACTNFCKTHMLQNPNGRWKGRDGVEYRTVTLNDALLIRTVLSCFPSKDTNSPNGLTFRALVDMGGEYRGPGSLDYKPLYDTDWAARIRAAYMPEFDQLYGSGAGKTLLPEGTSNATMVKDIKAAIKAGTVPDEYKELIDAWERAQTSHPMLVAQAKASLYGSSQEVARLNRTRTEAGGTPRLPFLSRP